MDIPVKKLSINGFFSLSGSGPRTRLGQRNYYDTDYWSLKTDQVGEIGLEPTTFAMSTRCSNQLSYPPESEPHYTDCHKNWQSLAV